MDPALYTTLSATMYLAPTLPNRTPPRTLTAVEREKTKKIYLKAKGEYDNHNTMQELLKTHSAPNYWANNIMGIERHQRM
eukprot:8810010-Ditylum_brightwellii.AAC.1